MVDQAAPVLGAIVTDPFPACPAVMQVEVSTEDLGTDAAVGDLMIRLPILGPGPFL